MGSCGLLRFEYGIWNMKFAALVFLLFAVPLFGQGGGDTDQDGLQDNDELRYGLSPYLADTNLNNRPDLQQVGQWEVAFPADQPAWSTTWMPDVPGTYRFTLNASEPVRLRVNDTEIPPFSGNTYEVIGVLAEELTLSVERVDVSTPASSGAMLAASFIDGMDADGDGLSLDWEMALHLDPAKPDTDGDGLADGDEVIVYGTDPSSADTNRDGLPDYVEVLTLSALQIIEVEGFWEEKLECMAARNPAKALLYRLPLPYAGNYRLGAVTHPDSTASGTLKFYVDGILQGETTLQPGPAAIYHWININIPQPVNTASGRPSLSHAVRIEWENKTPGTDAGELLLQQVYVDYIDNREDSQDSR